MEHAYRIHGHIDEDGTLTLKGLPFRAGEEVEVIVLAEAQKTRRERQYPLRGTPLRFEQPTEPVADSEWQALS
jgi:hypothetical protein